MKKGIPKEGELYKVYTVCGNKFDIRYGYYEEDERGRTDPVPIFPDFIKNPIYNDEGYAIVALIQLPCEYYAPRNKSEINDWCGDCLHYSSENDEIALCMYKKLEDTKRKEDK